MVLLVFLRIVRAKKSRVFYLTVSEKMHCVTKASQSTLGHRIAIVLRASCCFTFW